jgi:CRP-like cAMP-binding protein
LRERRVSRGSHIIEQGASDHSLFVVRDGVFEVRVRNEAGVDRTVAQLFPGDYVGEASLLTGAPRNATVEAATRGVVYEIEKAHFEPYLNARPEMAETLAAVLVARMAERDAAPVATNGGAQSTLVQVASQIRAFFRR